MTWEQVALGDVATIERRGIEAADIPVGTRYVGLENISSGQEIIGWQIVGEVQVASSKFRFDPGHVLYGKLRPNLGKIARPDFSGVCSTDILPIRPGPKLNRDYLRHFLAQPSMIDFAASRAAGANLPRLSPRVLGTFEVPLPPLEEQRSIAAILDQADALRAKRRQVLARLDDLTQAIFVDMFGDPRTGSRYGTDSLIDVCHLYSGGTPSKANPANWSGTLPWFSPKDLKRDDLWDATDHIADSLPERTPLRRLSADTAVIVVRGMILARDVPISVLRCEATINQDLKALVPKQNVDAQFLAAALRAQRQGILASVSTAAHGTKRLDAQALQAIRVPRPGSDLESEFAMRVRAVEQSRRHAASAADGSDELFESAQARAFCGGL